LYFDSVVSSQFDADRLDYMRRDRMMTGVESSGIDATWLQANLEVASVRTGADAEAVGSIETLVLGPKAFHAAENYVLSLFQLYPNVYFHKATKAAESVFSCLMLRVVEQVRGITEPGLSRGLRAAARPSQKPRGRDKPRSCRRRSGRTAGRQSRGRHARGSRGPEGSAG
jgi:hypothetical protein